MIAEIQKNIDKIAEACNRHHVKSLYLFGSAPRQPDFNKTNDLDFLVEFAYNHEQYNESVMEQHVKNTDLFKSALVTITNRQIDL